MLQICSQRMHLGGPLGFAVLVVKGVHKEILVLVNWNLRKSRGHPAVCTDGLQQLIKGNFRTKIFHNWDHDLPPSYPGAFLLRHERHRGLRYRLRRAPKRAGRIYNATKMEGKGGLKGGLHSKIDVCNKYGHQNAVERRQKGHTHKSPLHSMLQICSVPWCVGLEKFVAKRSMWVCVFENWVLWLHCG